MAATIAGTTFSDTTTMVAGETYLPEGQLSVSGKLYEIARITSPGADGSLPKNYGFRTAKVSGIVAFTASSAVAAMAAAAAFGDTLAPADFSATISGVSMTACGNALVVPFAPFMVSNNGTLVGVCYANVSFDWMRTA